MAKTVAWGDIVIIDHSDIGTLSVGIISSLPLYSTYNPNTDNHYSPDWSQTNLVLTPQVIFNGDQLNLSAKGLTFTWERQFGAGSRTELTTGESVKNGILTVSKNVLSQPGQSVTYTCTASYLDPNTNDVTLRAVAQISFSMIGTSKELSDCTITGDNTFKYAGDGTLLTASSIVLTAHLTNTTIKQWQYKNVDGEFVSYPGASVTTTLTVKDTDDVFVNDLATIKLVTSNDNLFEIHQIAKLRDGAAGNSTYTCNLTNDTQSVPCTSNGELYSTSLNGCVTTIQILKGSTDDTNNWTITATPCTGVTGTYDKKTHTYTVTDITIDSGYVEFICTRSGYSSITKRFSINKDRSGSDGNDAVLYDLRPDVGYLTLDKNKVFVPSGVTFSAYVTVGNNTPTVYSGRYKIYESADGSTYTLKYTSSSDSTSIKYVPSTDSVKTIKCELYASGSTNTLKDTQTISVVTDGTDGEHGKDGDGAINVVVGNASESVHCTYEGIVSEAKDILIPFDCYQGLKRIAGKASVATPLPDGVTLKSNTPASENNGGLITLSIAKGSKLFNALSGDITITFLMEGLTSVYKFNLSKNPQSASGENAVLFQLYAPLGSDIKRDFVSNSINNVVIESRLTDGSNVFDSTGVAQMLSDIEGEYLTDESNITLLDVSSNDITYQWALYEGTGYKDIPNATSASLVVTDSMVDSMAYIRCTAVYKGTPYIAFWGVTDTTDPLSVKPFSSLGDQLVNGRGINDERYGALFARAYQVNTEIDNLKSDTFSLVPPSSATKGDFYYKIDKTAKTVTLQKYNGTAWQDATGDDLPKGTYSWYRTNSMGKVLDNVKPFAIGKAVFLDDSVVDGKCNFACKIEIDITD